MAQAMIDSAVLDIDNPEDSSPLLRDIVLDSCDDRAAQNMRNFLDWSPERKASFIRAMEGGEFDKPGAPLTPNFVYARHRMVANIIMFSHQYLK